MENNITKTARLLAKAAACWLVVAAAASGQTVRPVVDELHNPGKGWVEYVNDGLVALNVVLEARSFTVSETGEITYRPLDPEIHLRLSSTSFRIQPKQTYYVSYEASADQAPAWFVIYAGFTGFGFQIGQGINTRLLLPHTVYLLPKQSLEKSDVRIKRAEFSPADGKVTVDVENTGDYFGRVLETNLVYSKKKEEEPGFPLYPHSHRIMEFSLSDKNQGQAAPTAVLLQFSSFKLEEKLERRTVTASAGNP